MSKTIEAVRSATTLRSTWAVVLMALVAVSGAQATGTSNALVNECNSDITVSQVPMTPEAGQTVNFTLTISSTDSRDNMNNPVAQEFAQATFTGDCMQPPGLPCNANVGDFMFLGNLGGTCPGAGAVGAAGVVTVSFVPDLSLLIPAPATPVSCTVTFDGVYATDGVYAAQANTSGICLNPGFPPGSVNSDTTVTSVVNVTPMMVPTVGEAGLAILALILMTGSWLVLRRKNAAPTGTDI